MVSDSLRNRIKEHRRVRLGDLVVNDRNPRLHTPEQRRILRRLYQEIGFARSVLAYELPDGRLKLIDGHLRAAMTPDQELDVEVLDVTEQEADILSLTLDPLAAIAEYDQELLNDLRRSAAEDSEAVRQLWNEAEPPPEAAEESPPEEAFYVVIECDDEDHQRELLRRFRREGLACTARVV